MSAVTVLRQENITLKTALNEQSQRLVQKDQRIAQLEEILRTFNRSRYGASSEQSPDQGHLFDEAEQTFDEDSLIADNTTTVPAHTRKKRRRVSIPADILRQDIIHDLPDDQKFCPHDGTALQCIDKETHEQLDIVPAEVTCLRHIRLTYACPCCEAYVVTAQKPKQPIEKSIAAPGLLAHIAISKYADALPLYRQSTMFTRIGVDLDRTSLANWMVRCGKLAQPLVNRFHDQFTEQSIVHMDETPLQVLNEPGKTPQSKSTMWVMATTAQAQQPVIVFHYAPNRSAQIPKEQLVDYHGALMVDGYEGYQAVCTQNQLTRLGCWAHARRKFVDAQRLQPKNKTGKADQALAYIQKLYAIEKQVKDQPPDERYAIRQQQAKPIIDKLHAWLQKGLPGTPPKTALGKALYYLHKQWPRLIGYLEDGHYPIDNNRAENAIRPFVIGRKNWLFSASQNGAKASANLYTLIETAKANGLNPYEYLKQVFTQLPNAETLDDVDKLLPWNVNL
jgi:transposase